MGVKSTVSLSRRQAEEKFVELRLRDDDYRRRLRAEAVCMDNRQLENALEVMNDDQSEGEGFENYLITDHG